MPLRDQIQTAMTAALRAREKERLATIRLMLAAIKQQEVDERITLDDAQTIVVLEKMVKQRRESIRQYEAGDRADLVRQEQRELDLIKTFLPEALSESELSEAIDTAMQESAASSMRDMGKVMGLLKPRLAGRADMADVSSRVKARLAS